MTGLLSHTLFNPGGMRGMDFPNPTPTLQHSISNTPGLPKPLLFTRHGPGFWSCDRDLVDAFFLGLQLAPLDSFKDFCVVGCQIRV